MAHIPMKPPLLSLLLVRFFLTIFLIMIPFSCICTENPESSALQNLLNSQGLPGGLFPENIKSYEIDEKNGHLEVFFEQPCLAVFETNVRFDRIVRANLSYGGLLGVEGLTQQELFLWLPVKDIIVSDPSSGVIMFNIGYAEKQLALSLFLDPPICKPLGHLKEMPGRKDRTGYQVLK